MLGEGVRSDPGRACVPCTGVSLGPQVSSTVLVSPEVSAQGSVSAVGPRPPEGAGALPASTSQSQTSAATTRCPPKPP